MNGVSPQFEQAIREAIALLQQVPDDSINTLADDLAKQIWATQVMMSNIPEWVTLYPLVQATPEMASAGGCPHCTYLGLWSDYWPGFKTGKHGAIWLFQNGIYQMGPRQYSDLVDWRGRPMLTSQIDGGQLTANTYEVLLHELGHALQRNHVLDDMERLGYSHGAGARAAHDCGQCPGRSSF